MKDKDVAELVEALKAADKAFEAGQGRFVNNYLSLRQNPRRFDPKAFSVIDDFRLNAPDSLAKFDIFARSYHLRHKWKLEPALMQQLNKDHGPIDFSDPNKRSPLDWRHPDTHAIYWAVRGFQIAGEGKYYSAGEINADRMVNHSLQNLFRYGKIFIYNIPPQPLPDAPETERMPAKEIYLRSDLRMFESYNKSTMARIKKYEGIDRTGSYTSLRTGHRNMLKNAVFSFYQAGHTAYAQKIYNQLKQLYPRDEFKVPLIAYVRSRLKEELFDLSLKNASEIVQMMLRESYFRYAVHDDEQAFAREKMAREAYDSYQSRYRDENRINLPDFKLFRYFALQDFLYDRQYPPNLRGNLLGRIKVERPDFAEKLKHVEEDLQKQMQQEAEQQK